MVIKKIEAQNQLKQTLGFLPTRVLIVYPHPDDETAPSGGLTYLLRLAGLPTRILILTKGEASSLHFGLKSTARLAEIRSRELQTALKILRVDDFQQFNFTDGKTAALQTEITELLQTSIQDYAPDLVITYEPDGVYGHIDHIVVSTILTHLISKTSCPLLYTTIKPQNRISNDLQKMQAKPKIQPLVPNIVLKLTWSIVFTKFKALLAHRSQFGNPRKIFFWSWQLFKGGWGRVEYYHLVTDRD